MSLLIPNAAPRSPRTSLTNSRMEALYLEVKTNGTKAWRYRFSIHITDNAKGSTFTVGDYAIAPRGESDEDALARRKGRHFTLAE